MVPALEEILRDTRSLVFFGGAGVSTESGIPDFRSVDGLYHQKFKYPPETMLSHTFYKTHTAEFYDFYRQKLIVHGAKPNAAHLRLAKLEREGKCKAVVTQNIDGLHQAAGSKNVLELHGSVHRNHCERCGKFYSLDHILHTTGVPRCACGGIIKPDVVLYEESLDQRTIEGAVEAIRYYGGEPAGVTAIFATVDECAGYPVASIFDPHDLPDYQSYDAHSCPWCKEGKKIDALVNSFGYSSL